MRGPHISVIFADKGLRKPIDYIVMRSVEFRGGRGGGGKGRTVVPSIPPIGLPHNDIFVL